MMAALRAERLKLRRSTVLWLPLFGLSVGTLQGGLFLLNARTAQNWAELIAWHTLWITFLSPLTLALICGLTTRREVQARGGGRRYLVATDAASHVARRRVRGDYTFFTHAGNFYNTANRSADRADCRAPLGTAAHAHYGAVVYVAAAARTFRSGLVGFSVWSVACCSDWSELSPVFL